MCCYENDEVDNCWTGDPAPHNHGDTNIHYKPCSLYMLLDSWYLRRIYSHLSHIPTFSLITKCSKQHDGNPPSLSRMWIPVQLWGAFLAGNNLIDVHVCTCVQQQVHCWVTQLPCMCLVYVGPQYYHTEEESWIELLTKYNFVDMHIHQCFSQSLIHTVTSLTKTNNYQWAT